MKKYEEFASEFIEALQAEMPNTEIARCEIPKVNGARDGVAVRMTGTPVAPVIYIEDMFHNFVRNDISARECAEFVAEDLKQMRLSMSIISDTIFEDAENKLCACVVNKNSNRKLLAEAPHRDIPNTDLSMIAKFNLSEESAFMINNDNYAHIGLTLKKVMDIAIANSAKDKFTCDGMNQTLADMMRAIDAPEHIIKEYTEGPDLLYVLTNEQQWQGAVAIGIPEVMKKATEVLGEEKAYIIPSSIHELLLMPASLGKFSVWTK